MKGRITRNPERFASQRNGTEGIMDVGRLLGAAIPSGKAARALPVKITAMLELL